MEAVEFIGADRPGTATAWLKELLERVRVLHAFAKRGSVVPEIGKATHRQLFHDPSRIIYRIDASWVVILTIHHGRRAWDPADVASGA